MLTVNGEKAACIKARQDLTVNSGTYTFQAERTALQALYGVLHVTGSAQVNAECTETSSLAVGALDGGRLVIDGSSVIRVDTGLQALTGQGRSAGYAVEIAGQAQIYADAGGYAIYAYARDKDAAGILITGDAYIECSAQKYIAICADLKDIQISGNAEIAKCDAPNGNPIYSPEGAVQISGHAQVTAEGLYGIQAGWWDWSTYTRYPGDIIISDQAKVSNTSTADYGMYATNKVTISGSADVDVSGYLSGLCSDYGIEISGGTVDAHAETEHGILNYYGGDITIRGNAVVTASTQNPEKYYALASCDSALIIQDSAQVFAKDEAGNLNSITAFNGSTSTPTPIKILDSAVVEAASIFSYGPMELSGSGVQVTVHSPEGTSYPVLRSNDALTISGGAHVSAFSQNHTAIYTAGGTGDVSITGAGTLVECVTGDDKSAGIWSGGKILIDDGAAVRISSPYFGFYSKAPEPGADAPMEDYPVQIAGAWVETVEKNSTMGCGNAVVFKDGVGRAYGTAPVMQDVAIPTGAVLTIPASASLTVLNDAALTNSGTLNVEGVLEVMAAGQFTGTASVSGQVYVFETAGGPNPVNGAAFNLTDSGAVYSQQSTLPGATIPNAGIAAGSYPHTSPFGSGEEFFVNEWRTQHAVYSVAVSAAPAQGGTVSGSGSYRLGATVTLTATANPGWSFSHWEVLSGSATIQNNSFIMPGGDVSIQAVFLKQSSGGGGGGAAHTIWLPKPEHGTVSASPSGASKGDTVTLTITADTGYELNNLTVTDGEGNKVELTDQGSGRYTFIMPGSQVEISASFREIAQQPDALPFIDVAETAWYVDGVRYVYERGLMTGTSSNTFSPEATTSRAMLAAILWRAAGSPVVDYAMDFADVEQGQWYTEAIRWAASEGIVGGYGEGTFGTNDPITREQLAVMLWRYAQAQGYDVSVGENTNILSYADVGALSEWAVPAMQWACGAGLITGTGDGSTLTPQGQATRAQAAALFLRFGTEYTDW